MIQRRVLVLVAISCSMLGIVCTDEGPVKPQPPTPAIRLTLTDTTCTEAWLTLSFYNYSSPHPYTVFRGSVLISSGMVWGSDTLIIDEGLLPKRQYLYTAHRLGNNGFEDSITTTIMTMDTTSHEIAWEIHYFGDYGSNILWDVALLNGDNVWAVGEINLYDSLGQRQSEQYGLVRWDGSDWTVSKIYDHFKNNDVQYLQSLLPRSIKVFSENDVWFANGSVYHWNGSNIIPYYLKPFPGNPHSPIWTTTSKNARKVDGISSHNLFVVGTDGAAAHFDGLRWSNIQTNTTNTGRDILIEFNNKSDSINVYGLFSEISSLETNAFLNLKDENANGISSLGISSESVGIWGLSSKRYFVIGDGIYTKRSLSSPVLWHIVEPRLTQYHTNTIDGISINNIAIAGSFGELLHFNGVSWKSFKQHPIFSNIAEITSLAMSNKIIVAVGYNTSGRSFVLIGKQ